MKLLVFVFLSVFCSGLNAQEYSIADLKAGRYMDDTSYIYSLPFPKNKEVFLIQAYDSKMSHKGEYSLDFKVRKGTAICAAREGVVVGERHDSNKGGLKTENLADGNYLTILHPDGTIAHYWHLLRNGTLVKMGDTVVKGQIIAESGNTGYSAFPHLHFEVMSKDSAGIYRQIPTRFSTNIGTRYLRPARFYRNPEKDQ